MAQLWIWANQLIHSFLVGCLNPCLQETNVYGLVRPNPVLWARPTPNVSLTVGSSWELPHSRSKMRSTHILISSCINHEGSVHMGSEVVSLKSLKVNLCNLNRWEHGSWDLPLHMGSLILSPMYDMTHMPTWQLFLDVRRKARPNTQHKSNNYLCMKQSRSAFNDN